jgi:hypothetical protein
MTPGAVWRGPDIAEVARPADLHHVDAPSKVIKFVASKRKTEIHCRLRHVASVLIAAYVSPVRQACRTRPRLSCSYRVVVFLTPRQALGGAERPGICGKRMGSVDAFTRPRGSRPCLTESSVKCGVTNSRGALSRFDGGCQVANLAALIAGSWAPID